MPKLVLQYLGSVIREIPITKTEVIIGRTPDNDVVIDNPSVSTHHCKISQVGDTFWVEDLKSTNGLFLNAKSTEKAVIQNNDIIGIVKHTLKFIDDRQHRIAALAAAGKFSTEATMMLSAEKQQDLAATAVIAAQRKPAVVRVLQGVVDQLEIELKGRSTYIGKSRRAQIRIKGTGLFGWAPESAVMIANHREGYFLIPVKENYAKLNGRVIKQKEPLKDGDVIQAGGTTMRFEESLNN